MVIACSLGAAEYVARLHDLHFLRRVLSAAWPTLSLGLAVAFFQVNGCLRVHHKKATSQHSVVHGPGGSFYRLVPTSMHLCPAGQSRNRDRRVRSRLPGAALDLALSANEAGLRP